MKQQRLVGRPLIYQEETKVVSFRIPKSAIKEVKEIISNHLEKLRVYS